MTRAHKSEGPVATDPSATENTVTRSIAPAYFLSNAPNKIAALDSVRQRKDESTLIARLALEGHAVHATVRGDFLVCKYGLSYYARDFDSLQAIARKLGVVHV